MALWPLNAQRGVAIDGTDVVGAYSFQQAFDAKYLVTAFVDAPDVPGLSAASNGSAGFRSTAGGARSYLLLNGNNAGAVSSFADPSGSTFEAYVKRTEGATGDFIFIGAGTPGTFPTTIGEMRMNFTYSNAYPNKGFCLYVNGMTWLSGTPMQGGDAQFKDAKGNVIDLTPHVWVHLALVRSVADNVTTYTLYLDGEEKGHVSGTGKVSVNHVEHAGEKYQGSCPAYYAEVICWHIECRVHDECCRCKVAQETYGCHHVGRHPNLDQELHKGVDDFIYTLLQGVSHIIESTHNLISQNTCIWSFSCDNITLLFL